MATLKEDQLKAINAALNKELVGQSLPSMISNLEQVYFDYTRLLVTDATHIHAGLEIQLTDFSAIIQVLQKGL